MTYNRRKLRSYAIATASVLLLGLGSNQAEAGLQKWSTLYLDAAGNPTSIGKAASAETYLQDQKAFTISFGCQDGGGYFMAIQAPATENADIFGPEIEPALRVSKPGTDLFRGPIGKMIFDGKRYVGPAPDPIINPLKEKIRDGKLLISEYLSRSQLALKTERLERTLAELNCS